MGKKKSQRNKDQCVIGDEDSREGVLRQLWQLRAEWDKSVPLLHIKVFRTAEGPGNNWYSASCC